MSSRTEAIENRIMVALGNGQKPELTGEEMLELVRQLQNYRELATGLANVIAATAEDLLNRKATSRSERGRQSIIVRHALGDLQHEVSTYNNRQTREFVVTRLQSIVDSVNRDDGYPPLRAGHSHSAFIRCCEPCPAYGKRH